MAEQLTRDELSLSPEERLIRIISNEDSSLLTGNSSALILDTLGIPTIGIGTALIIRSGSNQFRVRDDLQDLFDVGQAGGMNESDFASLESYLLSAVTSLRAGQQPPAPPAISISKDLATEVFVEVFKAAPEDNGLETVVRNLFQNRGKSKEEGQAIYEALGGDISSDPADRQLSNDSMRLEAIRDIVLRGTGQLMQSGTIGESVHGDLHDKDLIEITIELHRAMEDGDVLSQVDALNAGFDRILLQMLSDNNTPNAGGVDVRYFRDAVEYYLGTHLPADAFNTGDVSKIAQLPAIGEENQVLVYQLLKHIEEVPELEARLREILDSEDFSGDEIIDSLVSNLKATLEQTGIVGTDQDDVGDDALIDGVLDDQGNIVEEFDVNLLEGGAGNDTLTGLGGADVFVFNLGDGNDTITDFSIMDGDAIRFGAGVSKDDLTSSKSGDDLKIDLGSDTITINGFFLQNPGATFELLRMEFGEPPVVAAAAASSGSEETTFIEVFAIVGPDGKLYFEENIQELNPDAGSSDGDGPGNIINGSAGGELLEGTEGKDTINGNGGDDNIRGLGGNDKLNGQNSAGDSLLIGGGGNDTLLGGDNGDLLFGDEHRAPLPQIGDGNDLLIGGDGDDRMDGGAGNDIILGGAGNDRIHDYYSTGAAEGDVDGNDIVVGGDGLDVIQSWGGDDIIFGGLGDDQITIEFTNASDQRVVFGGAGDDRIIDESGTAQRAIFIGGDGNDSIGVNPGLSSGDPMPGALIFGGNGDDLILAKNSEHHVVFAGAGNDEISASTGQLHGGDGDDVIFASRGNNTAFGDDGNDNIFVGVGAIGFGGAGNDIVRGYTEMHGGDGNDSLMAFGLDFVTGEFVDALLIGGSGNDILDGAQGNDTLLGGVGNDVLIGGFGMDIMTGGGGSDAFLAERGDNATITDYSFSSADVIRVTSVAVDGLTGMRVGDDFVLEASGFFENNFTVQNFFNGFSGLAQILVDFNDGNGPIALNIDGSGKIIEQGDNNMGTEGDDNLTGTDGDDLLSGLGGNDLIAGLAGADELDGGAGNDTLDGGAGNDVLIGNEGDDVILAGAGDDTIIAGSGLGDDDYDGGDGNDTIIYSSTSFGVTVDLTAGTGSGAEVDSDTIVNVENVVGGMGDDSLRGDGADNTLNGLTGSDTYFVSFDGSQDTIIEAIDDGATDQIVFEGAVDPAELVFTANGDDLTISHGPASGSVTVQGFFVEGAATVESFDLGGGLVVSAEDVTNAVDNGGSLALAPELLPESYEVFSNIREIVLEQEFSADTGAYDRVNGRNRWKRIRDVDETEREDLTLQHDLNVTVNFVSESAWFKNTLGMYTIAADGTIENVQIIEDNASSGRKGLSAGDVLADLGTVEAGTEIGFFLIGNGFRNNQKFRKIDLENGELKFMHRKSGELTNIDDNGRKMQLYFEDADSGKLTKINGHVWHATGDKLNRDGKVHANSGINEDGNLQIGFEDLYGRGDADYNDVVIEIAFEPKVLHELAGVAIGESLTVFDPDRDLISGAEIFLTTSDSDDLLTLDLAILSNTNVTLTETATALILSGEDTPEAYEAILESLRLENGSDGATAGERTVDIKITDADGQMDASTVTVNIGSAGQEMVGTEGNDLLFTTLDNDVITTNDGQDIIIFGDAESFDTIRDFELGSDALDISNVLEGFDPVADALDAFVTTAQVDGSTEIRVSADGSGAFETIATLENLSTDLNELVANGAVQA